MLTGGCFCGNVRYEVWGTPFHATVCHCVDCRRCTAAPLVAWFSVKRPEFRIVHGQPKRFASSQPVMRTFCPDCGTPLTYQHDGFPDEIDISTCSLDSPDLVTPEDQTWTSQKLAWVHILNTLPEHQRSRSQT